MRRSLPIVLAAASLALGAPSALAAPAVTTTADSGPGSLRAALAGATAGDTIAVPAGTYLLASELVVARGVTIDGAAADATVLDGQGATRVLRVPSPGAVTISDLTVRRGAVTGTGGGILHDGAGALTLERAMLLDNAANGAGGGGGLYHGNPLAPLTIVDSTVSQNTAALAGSGSGGGGVHVEGVLASLTNSTISRNRVTVAGVAATSGGGGYYAGDGGGDLNNVTLVANVAEGVPGGGIFNRSGPGVGLANTIVANNSSNCSGAIASGGSNLENTNSCGLTAAGDLPATPSPIGALEQNGGPTLTHRLVPESPAIDAGGAGTACESEDQRGVSRAGVGPACDIGAYEFDGAAVAAIPACSQSGAIPVTITAVPGQGVQSIQYRAAGGPTQIVPIPQGGSQAQRTVTLPEGRAAFEYWGDFTNDPSTGQPGHRTASVLVDRTKPTVAVTNPNRFDVFVIKRRPAVQVSASDSLSGLTSDPSGRSTLDTSARGSKSFAPAAVDLCTNRATAAPFDYRVLAPRLGVRTVIERDGGRVRSRASGGGAARASQRKGRRFSTLREPREIPIRSLVDARRGTARLTSSRNRGAEIQDGRFRGGVFQVLQSRRRRAKGLTVLRLKGASFRRCRARGGRASAAARRRGARRRGAGRVIRRLRGRGRGRFRTRGRFSSATVRGTRWTVEDRCDGTLTTVKRGRVAVRDFRRSRTVIVRAGKRYLARAPR